MDGRLEEIIANVWYQIDQSGFDDKLMGVIIVTVGTANLKNIQALFVAKTHIEKFRIASTVIPAVMNAVPSFLYKDGRQNSLLGRLYAARDNWYMPDPVEVEPELPVVDETSTASLSRDDEQQNAEEHTPV